MKAILVKSAGNASQLKMGKFPTPEPSDNELLVKVKATALNRADILQAVSCQPLLLTINPNIKLQMLPENHVFGLFYR